MTLVGNFFIAKCTIQIINPPPKKFDYNQESGHQTHPLLPTRQLCTPHLLLQLVLDWGPPQSVCGNQALINVPNYDSKNRVTPPPPNPGPALSTDDTPTRLLHSIPGKWSSLAQVAMWLIINLRIRRELYLRLSKSQSLWLEVNKQVLDIFEDFICLPILSLKEL